MIALVRLVMAAATRSASMLKLSGSISTNTGVAPTRDTAMAVDTNEIAGFIVSSMQGAILLSKAHRSPEPIERFRRVLFASVLQ